MAAVLSHADSEYERESSSGSSSTPSGGYAEVGLGGNTNLSFERHHSFLNWLLLGILLGCTSTAASLLYFSVSTRHEIVSTVRDHLTGTPFAEGQAPAHWAWTGGWLSTSGFSKAVELRTAGMSSRVIPESANISVASNAITTWADVEAWLRNVFAPTLYNGSLGGVIVVQKAQLTLTKGSVQANDDSNTQGLVKSKLNSDGKVSGSAPSRNCSKLH